MAHFTELSGVLQTGKDFRNNLRCKWGNLHWIVDNVFMYRLISVSGDDAVPIDESLFEDLEDLDIDDEDLDDDDDE